PQAFGQRVRAVCLWRQRNGGSGGEHGRQDAQPDRAGVDLDVIDGLAGGRAAGYADLDADEGRVDRTGGARGDRERFRVGRPRGGDILRGRRDNDGGSAVAATAARGQEPQLDER